MTAPPKACASAYTTGVGYGGPSYYGLSAPGTDPAEGALDSTCQAYHKRSMGWGIGRIEWEGLADVVHGRP